MQVSAQSLRHLQAVFGDCVPKHNAAAMLEDSPLSPTSPAELQALRAVVVAAAGKRLADFMAQSASPALTPTATSASHAAALHMRQVHAARELRTPDGLLKVLTEKKAAAVFQQVAAMKDVPHAFLEEGCVHRSHVIAKRLEDDGLFTEKIFAIPTSGDLVIESKKAKLGFTVTIYHEAVVVHVHSQSGSGLERRVLDPSVADQPLTVPQWLSTMHPSPVTPMGDRVPDSERASLETFFLPRFAYGLSDRNEPPTSWSNRDLLNALAWHNEAKVVQHQLESSGFYHELPKLAGKAPGQL